MSSTYKDMLLETPAGIGVLALTALSLGFGCQTQINLSTKDKSRSAQNDNVILPQQMSSSPSLNTSTYSNSINVDEEAADGLAETFSDEDTDSSEFEETDVAEEDIPQEELGDGYCKDDVYTQYLMRRFPAPHQPKVAGRRASRKSSAAKLEADRMHFARGRLVGTVAPYFGAIPVVANARVEYWIRYFKTEGRNAFLKWLVRGESLKDVVKPILIKEGLPAELFFLAMIESGFSNLASSRAKATGPWQFMGGTAKLYGLRINHWVDERRDPLKSTIAAARYMRDLYAEFGDWYLAMAAYNAGPGKVKRAITRTSSRDFWTISETKNLRPETKHYVPKVLGALILATDPVAHGFDVTATNPHDLPAAATVNVSRPVRLDDVAAQLGLSSRLVRIWNPELIHGVTPPNPGREGYNLRLSVEAATAFSQIESEIPEIEVQDIMMHRVQHGETLAKIARRYNVKVKQILTINPDIRASSLRVGRQIAVPVPSVVERTARRS